MAGLTQTELREVLYAIEAATEGTETSVAGGSTEVTSAAILAKLTADPATDAGLTAILNKLSADPATDAMLQLILNEVDDAATETTLASVLAKMSNDPATDAGQALVYQELVKILAKQSADPATQTTLAALKTVMDNFESKGFPFRDQDGNAHTLHFVDGAFSVVAMDFEFAITMGICLDKGYISKFGLNSAVPNGTFKMVWEGQTTPYPGCTSDSMALQFASSNGGDTALGAGAQSVEIQGLDATTFLPKTQVYPTAGAALTPIGNWARVFRGKPVADGGTGGPMGDGGLLGTITVSKVAGAVPVLLISPTYNKTQMAFWTVPAGKRVAISEWRAGSPENKAFTVQILKRERGQSWESMDTQVVGQGSETWETPFSCEEKCDICIMARGEGVSGQVNAGFKGIYEDTPVP